MRQLKPVFIDNENTRNFIRLMDAMDRGAGEGRLACISGRAGRGKTRTAIEYHANHENSVYLRSLAVWTPKGFLTALAYELGEKHMPWSTNAAFVRVLDLLTAKPGPVFIDELERLRPVFLEYVRDLSDISGSPFILLGEEELPSYMSRQRRVWSRTLEHYEFQPLTESDIINYGREAAEMSISQDVAEVLNKGAGGDFRPIKRDIGKLLRICGGKPPTVRQAKTVISAGVRGK